LKIYSNNDILSTVDDNSKSHIGSSPYPEAHPLWQQVWTHIRTAILTGAYKKGERINETLFARQFGISRNPVREALRQLIQEGLAIYKPNIGTIVAEVSTTDTRTAADIRVFLETRSVEILSATGKLPATALALDRIARQMALLGDDPISTDPEELDARFHRTLVDASGSPLLRRLWALTDPYTYASAASSARDPRPTYDAGEHSRRHRIIVEAMATGSIEKTRAALVAHITGS
jgi:DNA-binding GntR family transcriptional regulator